MSIENIVAAGVRNEAERKVRARLENNGRNPTNQNAGIRVGSELHLFEMLLAELDIARIHLRRLAICQHVRMAYGGGYAKNGFSCKVCNTEWGQNAPEAHAVSCPLGKQPEHFS